MPKLRCALSFCSPFRSCWRAGQPAHRSLSQQAGADDRAVRAGRAGRPVRTADRAEAVRRPRQAILHREPGRRRRQLGVGHRRAAPADGYSLFVNSQATVDQPRACTRRCPTILQGPRAVTRIATTPNVIVVHPSVPAKTHEGTGRARAERRPTNTTAMRIPASARRRTCRASCSSCRRSSISCSIPFGGGGPMIQSVVAGHTPIAFSSLPPASPHIQAGTLARARRHRRSGSTACRTCRPWPRPAIPDQTAETPIGIFVPAGTPKEIVDLLHREVVALSPRRTSREARQHRLFADRRHARGIHGVPQGEDESGAR